MRSHRAPLPLLLLLVCAVSAVRAFLLPAGRSTRPYSTRRSSSRLGATTARANPAAAAAAAEPAGADAGDHETTRLRLGVFIEFTDRYGMVYNSNYLLFLNRCGLWVFDLDYRFDQPLDSIDPEPLLYPPHGRMYMG